MFEWLKKILGMQMNTPSPEQKDEEGVSVPNSTYDRLDEREKTAKNEKEGLTQSSTDWYSIKIQPKSVRQISKIFHSRKWEELPTLKSLKEIVKRLHEKNPNLNFQLVIEGNAAIPWQQLREDSYNADNLEMYKLSYRRALALYQRWRAKGLNFRNYNTEVIIAGSGFNGINRDMKVEENNKRFIIQIIPKISRPTQFNL